LKFFFIVRSLSGVLVVSVANVGFSSKTMNKSNIIKCCHWAKTTRLILVCCIRTYIIILLGIFPLTSSLNQYIGRDVSPASPAGLTPVVTDRVKQVFVRPDAATPNPAIGGGAS